MLVVAGVTPPANASASILSMLIGNAGASGRSALQSQLTNNNIEPAQAQSLIKAISLGG
jgi:hypothetical protein